MFLYITERVGGLEDDEVEEALLALNTGVGTPNGTSNGTKVNDSHSADEL